MARIESDREDLLREATALRRRVEFAVRGEPVSIVAGFRDDGSLSLYFGAEMMQFDADNQLRRAYRDGRLYRTEGNTLAELTRVRHPQETVLERHDLTAVELSRFLEFTDTAIRQLDAELQSGNIDVERTIPDDDVMGEVAVRIAAIAHGSVSLAPPINSRR